MEIAFLAGLIAAGIRLAIPLVLAGLGEALSQRSGVLSVGIEGYMALATITGFIGSYFTGSPWLGLLIGMIAGGVLGLIHGYLCVNLGLSQLIVGLGLMFFGNGLSDLGHFLAFGGNVAPKGVYFQPVHIPVLSEIPFFGPVLFQYPVFTYITFLLIPLFWFVLYKTQFGLKVRAVGSFTKAADASGSNVNMIRLICCIVSGMMSGLAGSFLVLGVAFNFLEGMVAGRGFIVLAAIVLGNWNPIGVLLASLLFGMIDAFQYRMQIEQWGGIPVQFWIMLPYIVAILVLICIRRVKVPPELTIPYLREARKEVN